MDVGSKGKPVDVICQHSHDGTVIPLRVRVQDEEGELQSYTIKGYKDLSHNGTRTMPDGVYVDNNMLIFECKITVFDRTKIIRLYNRPSDPIWRLTV